MRTVHFIPLAILSWLILTASPALGANYLVAPDGSGDYPDIAAAVGACVDGDEVVLADGMFTGPGNTNVLISNLIITIRSLSGSSINCRINCEGGPGTTTRAFVIENTPTWGLKIQDIAIENGYAQNDAGGAVLVHNAGTLELLNVAFRGNYADMGGALALEAGTIFVEVDQCRFLENVGGSAGGAICCAAGETDLINSLFRDNSTTGIGGACCVFPSGELSYSSCTYSRNLAGTQGGAIFDDGPDLDMYGCTLSGNSCAGGSALYIGPTNGAHIYDTLIAFSIEGMAIDCQTTTITIENCDLFGNGGGDWTPPIHTLLGQTNNISADPQFCSPIPDDHQNWTLQDDSPCTALNSPGGQIGAYGSDCGIVQTKRTSWGAIKWSFGQ